MFADLVMGNPNFCRYLISRLYAMYKLIYILRSKVISLSERL